MGNNSAASRKIFEQLDKNKTGKINVHEILLTNAPSDVPLLCSLATLYHFDFSKEGTLTFKEFVEMEKFVHMIQKQAQKSESPAFFTRLFSRAPPKSDENEHNHNSSFANLLSLQEKSSQTGSQPTSPTNGADGMVSMYTFTSEKVSAQKKMKDEYMKMRNKITIALLPSLNKEMYEVHNRKNFVEWLFKLSDIDKTNTISESELSVLLRAVQKDGISLSSLLFDPPSDDDYDVVEKVMEEYNQNGSGQLSRNEFSKLADVILNLYEAQHTESNMEKDDMYGNTVCGCYRLLYTLGEGSYGIVKYAEKVGDDPIIGAEKREKEEESDSSDDESHEDDSKRAIKIIKKGNVSELSQLDCEIQAMQMLSHPSIVKLHEVDFDDNNIYLNLELCGGGSLFEHLQNGPFPEPLARFYFYQLISGLKYCHDMGVCHRDLRLENLLLDNYGNLKITDFGQARIFKKGWDLFSTQLVGSLYHLSPEQILGKVYSGEKVDVWSAGIILYCFLTGRLPFNDADVMKLFDEIKECSYTYEKDDNVSDSAKDLIAKLLQPNPKDRLTPEQILSHPWMKGEKKRAQLMIDNIEVNQWFRQFKSVDHGAKELTNILCEELAYSGSHFRLCCDDVENQEILQEVLEDQQEMQDDPPSANKPVSEVNFDKLQLPAVTPIATKPVVCIKCISTKRNIKFAVFAEKTIDDSVFIVFHLREGESSEFKEMMAKLKKKLKKRLKI